MTMIVRADVLTELMAQSIARLLGVAKRRARVLNQEDDASITVAETLLAEVDFAYCRDCGCSENDACEELGQGCSWVEYGPAGLCSACALKLGGFVRVAARGRRA